MYYPTDPIKNVKGVGEWLEKKLRESGIKTVGDIINYFPFRHEDLSLISKISEIKPNEKIVIKGSFSSITTFATRTKKKITSAKFEDETGKVEVIWFNSPYIQSQLKENEFYTLTAKPSQFGKKINIVNPQIEKAAENSAHIGRIVPVYLNIPGIFMKRLRSMIFEAIENTQIHDFLDSNKNNLELKMAYRYIHFPENLEDVEKAKDRIALNELIHVKLHSEKQKSILKEQSTNFKIKKSYSEKFIKKLPFNLTIDQKNSVEIVIKQLRKTSPMNILLSGDVGSGKTIVSIIAANDVIKNGGKVVYLAPTVVLANQVFKEFLKYFDSKKTNIQLITSQTSKWNDSLLENSISNNKVPIEQWNSNVDILIGTHALLNIKMLSEYANFVIIDEQHKFGVKQRAKIIENKISNNPPHVLAMTATPIPRSLALAFFGELTIAQINTKPEGRQKITTKTITEKKRKDCYRWLKKEVISKNKVYHIVPFVKKSESENFRDIKSIEEMEKELIKEFGREKVLTLHGKLKDEEKNRIINQFKEQKGGILLATQVVEVGIDVREATVIIIESAERFGLASLHQLRGRVGRNNLKSYCFLFPSIPNKSNTKRLKYMEQENDGFKLAQLDLENRGGGEIFGIRQSGEIDLKFVDFRNTKLIEEATTIAKKIYKARNLLERYNNNYFTRDFFYIQDN